MIPPLDEMRYDSRPIRFLDTGEKARIATIDGEPVALEPSRAALEAWAKDMDLQVVTNETMRQLTWRR